MVGYIRQAQTQLTSRCQLPNDVLNFDIIALLREQQQDLYFDQWAERMFE